MLINYLAAHVWLHWWLLSIGAFVTGWMLWFASGVVLEIIYGFFRAIDFQSFKKKVGIADGKPYIFRFRYFFGAWFNLTGFTEGTTITVPTGHRYQGFRKHVILGKFTGTQNSIPDFDDETDEV
jgi:hypothetical protein